MIFRFLSMKTHGFVHNTPAGRVDVQVQISSKEKSREKKETLLRH